jgi:opacity protein-like surface antigen
MVLRSLGLAILLALVCLGAPVARAQTNPLTYWTPGWPIGFSGNASGQSANAYENFPGFESGQSGGFAYNRYNFSNGFFFGSESGALGLNSFSRDPAFGGLYSEGMQFGYNLQKSLGLPVAVFGGFDTLKYDTGIGNSLSAPFDSPSTAASGYSAHVGVNFQATSNLSLSLSAGYVGQNSGRVDSDINSGLLPGQSTLFSRH